MQDFEPVRQSYLQFLYSALGIKYTLLLPLAGLAAFVVTLIVVIRGKGSLAGVTLLFIVPAPFFIGLYGALEGTVASYQVIAASAVQPKPSELAQGISMALVTPMIGLLLMVPAYATATIGLLVRSLSASADRPPQGR